MYIYICIQEANFSLNGEKILVCTKKRKKLMSSAKSKPLYSDFSKIFLFCITVLTLCIPMDKSNKDGIVNYIFYGSQVAILQLSCISVPFNCFTLTNSVDPDETPHYVAFHLSLHCLSKCPFRGFQYTKC